MEPIVQKTQLSVLSSGIIQMLMVDMARHHFRISKNHFKLVISVLQWPASSLMGNAGKNTSLLLLPGKTPRQSWSVHLVRSKSQIE
jgi:hypothetical protein